MDLKARHSTRPQREALRPGPDEDRDMVLPVGHCSGFGAGEGRVRRPHRGAAVGPGGVDASVTRAFIAHPVPGSSRCGALG